MTASTTSIPGPAHDLTGNLILDGLDPAERRQVVGAGERVPLERGQTLYTLNEPIRHVWFPTSGLVSWITAAPDQDTVETAITGREGFIGVQVLLAGGSIWGQGVVLLSGEAIRIASEAFMPLVHDLPNFRQCLDRFVLALLVQTTQLSLCNRLHPMEERCARWLLMCHDRVDGDTFALTHEALAQLLGVRRASVTTALGALHKAGIITYHLGQMRIVDRLALEASACPCYQVMRREYARLLGSDPGYRSAGVLRSDP